MLTPRQREVAELVARGLSNKKIAHNLGISVETVNAHVRNAAERIPIAGRQRYRLILWVLTLDDA